MAKVSFLELKKSCSSALEAAAQMEKDKPDLLFLDINMPDLNGLSFISMLNPSPMIILTTAYDQYALKAFDLEVRDYLLKPISFERFYKTVLRLYQETKLHRQGQKGPESAPANDPECLFLKVGFRIQKVPIREILFVEGMKDYIRIQTTKEKIMTLLGFARLAKLLPGQKFSRVHRFLWLLWTKLKNRIRIGDQDIPIGDTNSDAFFKKLGDFLLKL